MAKIKGRKVKSTKKAYILPLLFLTLGFTIIFSFVLFYVIGQYGYAVSSSFTEIHLQLIYHRMVSVIPKDFSTLKNLIQEGRAPQEFQNIFKEYRRNGSLSIWDPNSYFQDTEIKLDFLKEGRIPVYQSTSLLTQDKIIVSSSDETMLGLRYFQNQLENQERLDQYMENVSQPGDILTLFENENNQWFNMYILISMRFFEDQETYFGFLLISIRNLDIKQYFNLSSIELGNLVVHAYDDNRQILFTFPDYSLEGNVEEEGIKDVLPLNVSSNPRDFIVITDIYRNNLNKRVIGASIWLDQLKRGLIFESPVSEVFAPWYIFIAIIWIIVMICLSFYLSITIFIDKKRLIAFDHNPLTHLPGNRSIMERISLAMEKPKGNIVIYCDLDNFKAYNDYYGFSAGDEVILFSADILVEFFPPSKKVFLGHIGGDDFVIIGPKEELSQKARVFGEEFDRRIQSCYSEEDRRQGFILSKNRLGQLEKFPLMAMSMGAVLLENYPKMHPARIGEICADVKKEAKKVPGSQLVMDRRGGLQ